MQLGGLFVKNPILLFQFIRATKKTLTVSQSIFGYAHQGTGKANAFRHAYWNLQICFKNQKILKNKQKSVFWCEKVTFFYEKVSKNKELDRAMDVHNNRIGQQLFMEFFSENEAFFVEKLKKLTQNAKKIENIEQIHLFPKNLVHL